MEKNDVARTNKNSSVVFQKRQSLLSQLYEDRQDVRSLYFIATISAICGIVSIIFTDSLNAGRLHWKVFEFIDVLTLDCFVNAVLVEFFFHLLLMAVHPIFNLWRWLRSSFGKFFDYLFLSVYVAALISSFVFLIWSCSYFNFTKYICVVLSVEQMRVCMKSYSFIRENAYKVVYPWHKDDNSGPAVWYKGQMSPTVGSFKQYCYFLFAPTLLYRDHYPRDQGSINWKTVLVNFCLFVGGMTIVFQIYTKIQIDNFLWINVVHSFVSTLPTSLLMLSMGATALMHGWMNMWAELLRFGDRRFYEDWWCSVTHQEYYRKWNTIPYHFNHQYLYKDIRKVVKSRVFAMFIMILASSLIHEYIAAVAFGFFLPVLTILFAGIGVVVVCCRLTGNYYILLSLFLGFHMMVWSYFIENNARRICYRNEETLIDYFYPRIIECVMEHSYYN